MQNKIVVYLAVIVVYAITNVLCVFLPFIPGALALFSWGVVFPVLAIIFTWINLVRDKNRIGKWRLVGVIFTSVYLVFGCLSFYIVVSIWASI